MRQPDAVGSFEGEEIFIMMTAMLMFRDFFDSRRNSVEKTTELELGKEDAKWATVTVDSTIASVIVKLDSILFSLGEGEAYGQI